MGANTSCPSCCKPHAQNNGPVRKINTNSSANSANQGLDARKGRNAQVRSIGDSRSFDDVNRSKASSENKDAYNDQFSSSEDADGTPMNRFMGEYNEMSEKGIKKPDASSKAIWSSGKSTQANGESSKDIVEMVAHTKLNRKTQNLTPSVSNDSSNSSMKRTSSEEGEKENEVLEALHHCTKQNTKKCLAILKANKEGLKTALMTPLSIFCENSEGKKAEAATFKHYNAEDEVYGLLLAIKNKNSKIFDFLWNKCGELWNEDHLITVVRAMVRMKWAKGISYLFNSDKCQDIYASITYNERKHFYVELGMILNELESRRNPENSKLTRSIMRALAVDPYNVFAFCFLFKHFHKSKTHIDDKDFYPENFSEELYLLANDTKLVHCMAQQFNDVLKGKQDRKEAYHPLILKMICCPCYTVQIPYRAIWKSIHEDREHLFRAQCNDYHEQWAKIITMRSAKNAQELSKPKKDDRVKDLKVHQWKPLHLMLYHERLEMIQDILEFSGTSCRKAINLENRKKMTKDEFIALQICIGIKSGPAFNSLWIHSNLWGPQHLFFVLKELQNKDRFSEDILKVITKCPTTEKIIKFCPKKVKSEYKKIIKKLKSHKAEIRKSRQAENYI